MKKLSSDQEMDLDTLVVPFNIIVKRIMSTPLNHTDAYISFMNKYGDKKITSIKIGRRPISDSNRIILNLLMAFNSNISESHRKLIKKAMYHTFLSITLEKISKTVRLEHNNTFIYLCFQKDISDEESKKRQLEYKDVEIPTNLTLKKLMYTMEDNSGTDFFIYSIRKNNCQTFVYRILFWNRLVTESLKKFILQEVDELFKNIKFGVEFKIGEINVKDFYEKLVHGK